MEWIQSLWESGTLLVLLQILLLAIGCFFVLKRNLKISRIHERISKAATATASVMSIF